MPSRSAGHPGHLARLLVVCAALLGLVAMHGLGDHGAAHGEQVSSGPMSQMSQMTAVTAVEHAAAETAGMSAMGDMDGMGAIGMCVAVLTLLLLLVGLSPSSGVLRRLVRLRERVLAPVVRGRPPPSLTLLSIRRC